MVFIGILAYTGIESYMMGMQKTADKFYKENNLQDLNVIGANFTTKDLDDIEKNVENAKAIIKIEDFESYKQYQGEIDEGKTYIGVFSGLFIFIAMLSVITTMMRVVKKSKNSNWNFKSFRI